MAVAQWIGQWAWVIAPWFWVIFYDPDWFESADRGLEQVSISESFVPFGHYSSYFVKSKSTLNDKNLTPLGVKYLSQNVGDIFRF